MSEKDYFFRPKSVITNNHRNESKDIIYSPFSRGSNEILKIPKTFQCVEKNAFEILSLLYPLTVSFTSGILVFEGSFSAFFLAII